VFRLSALTLSVCLSAFAADQIALSNGDIINGSIIRKDDSRLVLKSDLFGELSMPWSAVKSVHGDSPEFVHLFASDATKTKLKTSSNELLIVTTGGTKAAPNVQIAVLRGAEEQRKYERQEHPGIFDLWSGNMDLGLALARGNARTDTLTTSIVADRTTAADKVGLFLNQIYGTARVNNQTSTIASDVRAGWTYNRNLSPRMFVSTMNNYEHDRFQNLDLRFVAGAGVGWNAVKRDSMNFALQLGADYNRENYMDSLHRNFAEANLGDALQWKISKGTTVNQTFQLFNNLNERGDYRIAFDLGWVTAMRRWLAWHVTASDRYLSNPVQGRQRNDLVMSTGFRLLFSR
jgi:putative salt-induced outer membrane protein YdiY